MKKVANIVLTAVLMAGLLSCAKTDLIYDDTKTEIAMKPVMHTPTKEIVEGTTYPAGVNFGVLAYYSSAYGDQDKWTDLTGENAPVPYIDDQEFVSKGDGTFGGSDPCYWPHQGSLVFAGYSPYYAKKESVTFDPDKKALTITGFESDGQTDLMYFLPEVSDNSLVGLNSGGSSVPAAFSHALTLLEFNIKGIEGDKPIKLKKISIASGKWYSTGDFTVTAGGNPEWKNVATSGSDLVIYSSESGHLITTTPFSVSGLVIPGETVDMAANAVDITIDYEVNAAQTPQKSGTVEASLQPTWVIGNKYIYDIRLMTTAEPTASIVHVKDASGILTHSALNLNLNLVDAQLSRVKNLRVVVSKDGVDYLDQTFATVSSNEMTLYKEGSASDPGRFYMPQGEYQVTLTYNDGFNDQTVTCQATSTLYDRDYTLTVNVSATSNQFTVNSMSVNIADRVLAECPLSGHPSNSMLLRVTGQNPGYNYIYTYTSGVSLKSSTFLSNVIFSDWAPYSSGYYTILPYVTFDGVTKEGANCTVVTSNKYSGQYIYPNEVRYRTVSQINNSRNLEDGAMYVIRANWNSSLYWSVNTSTGQFVSGSSQTSFPKEYVFVYDRDASKEVVGGFIDTNDSRYKLESVGAWKSLATGKYMEYSNGLFNFNALYASSAQYVVCANGWETTTPSYDIDMCVDATRMIVYINGEFNLGTSSSAQVGSNQQWKWNIFKVEAE